MDGNTEHKNQLANFFVFKHIYILIFELYIIICTKIAHF